MRALTEKLCGIRLGEDAIKLGAEIFDAERGSKVNKTEEGNVNVTGRESARGQNVAKLHHGFAKQLTTNSDYTMWSCTWTAANIGRQATPRV